MVVFVAEMLFVVDVPVQPVGSVQMYEVAPVTGDTEYVCGAFEQMNLFPVMDAGGDGADPATTARLRGMETPQGDVAVTDMLPAALPGVTVMEFVVDVPVQPVGIVQAYVDPGTLGIE